MAFWNNLGRAIQIRRTPILVEKYKEHSLAHSVWLDEVRVCLIT